MLREVPADGRDVADLLGTDFRGSLLQSGKGILELIREKKLLTEAQIKDLLDHVKLTSPTGPTKLQE